MHLHVDEWGDERIAGLHARGDCYLTLTHGEGWGIGSFDACAYGNPVIATGWGGHMAYLEGSPWLVDYDLVAVDNERAVGSYAPSQRWGDPRLEHAVSLLRGSQPISPAPRRRRADPRAGRARLRTAGRRRSIARRPGPFRRIRRVVKGELAGRPTARVAVRCRRPIPSRLPQRVGDPDSNLGPLPYQR